MVLYLSYYGFKINPQERHKKTMIEPHHISPKHQKIAPDLYEVVQDAWANECEFSKEAVKELFVTLETYLQLKEVMY